MKKCKIYSILHIIDFYYRLEINMSLNIIGLSAFYHDSACCLLIDGHLKCAVQEERFTRKKNDNSLPIHAFRYCLESMNLSIDEIDYIAYYENPVLKLERQLWSGYDIENGENIKRMSPHRPENEIRRNLGYEGKIIYVDHHISHAASSYYYSGLTDAAIMTVDAVGEWDTTTYSKGKDNLIEIIDRIEFPHSIGLFYSTITAFLGFKVNSGEYKVMGLAPYGRPTYKKHIQQLVSYDDNGHFQLNLKYFDYIHNEDMFTQEMVKLFNLAPREPESYISQEYMDLACSLQEVLEDILIAQAKYIKKITNAQNLCLAGGVALNCVANSAIYKTGLFKQIFVQPASGDAGACLGAAAYVYYQILGNKYRAKELEHVFLGPSYSNQEIKQFLDATRLSYHDFSGKYELLVKKIASDIDNGKVVGWFQGAMEFGPRALGNRSILADPRNPEMRDKINKMVKKRETFRPFAPAVLKNEMKHYFDMDKYSPFMLFTYNVKPDLFLPAITHVNQSARVQTVDEKNRFGQLIKAFEKISGMPILLNTSFNMRGEPIVMNIEDAIICFVKSHLDCLVLGDYIIYREENNLRLLRHILRHMQQIKKTDNRNLYTFL